MKRSKTLGSTMPHLLYGYPGSGSMVIEMALAEIGIDYQVRDIDLKAEAQLDDSYASINPQRKLPCLVTPDGEILTESVAILLTLQHRHPGARLLPENSIDRAQALRWLLFVATEIYPIVEMNDYPGRFSPNPQSVHAVRELSRAIWRDRWLVVENGIDGDPYLLKSGFCMTDMYIAVVSRWAQQSRWRPKNVPKVEALAEAVSKRSTLSSVWIRNQPDNSAQ